MVFPFRMQGLALVMATIAMTGCEKKNHREPAVSVPANHEMSGRDGISWEERSYLSISGDTHGLCFRWHVHENDHWQEAGRVNLDRIGPAGHRRPLHFPRSIRLHEQQFQEGNITYFMTTGYLASKRLVFHRVRCDHPGALHVSAILAPGGKLEERSIRSGSPHVSRLWLLPFEAEVVSDQNSLIIEGEGELILLWHLSGEQDSVQTWQSLLREYDPGSPESELNVSVVADALQDAAREQH